MKSVEGVCQRRSPYRIFFSCSFPCYNLPGEIDATESDAFFLHRSAHIFPPVRECLLPADVKRLADLGREERVAPAFAQGAEVAVRCVPRVARERELAAVGGQHCARAHVLRCLRRLLGQHVNAVPLLVVLPVFHDGEVEAAEHLADFLEMGTVAAVAAQKDPALGRHEGEARPLRLVLLQEAS